MNKATQTERIYYHNSYLPEITATIVTIDQDEYGHFLIFDRTIFHPQGGGQPDDEGCVKVDTHCIPITKLWCEKDPAIQGQIKHYFIPTEQTEALFALGKTVTLLINLEKRQLFTRYHSAGHLLSNAVNILWPHIDGTAGNHFPEQSFVYFSGGQIDNFDKDQVVQKVTDIIAQDLPCHITTDKNHRKIQFGDLKPYPCGGTHVTSSGQVGRFEIRSVKFDSKTGRTKIGYTISPLPVCV